MRDVDTIDENAWCEQQRTEVVGYLGKEGLVYGVVGEWPAWHIVPLVALWAIESVVRPGWVGWWAISGDLPCDYVSVGPARNPREGLKDIATIWRNAAEKWATGERADNFRIGTAANERRLAPLLASRAAMLLELAADDGYWAK